MGLRMSSNAENPASTGHLPGTGQYRVLGWLSLLPLLVCLHPAGWAQAPAAPPLAPTPAPAAVPVAKPAVPPCPVHRASGSAAQSVPAGSEAQKPAPASPEPLACQPVIGPIVNWYDRFLSVPDVKPMTPKEKAHLAAHNVMDPFNTLTIFAISAISVGSDAHSPYGPGMRGYGKDLGTSYTQDMTGEFFGTFLIPSLTHLDPHYHRLPHAGVPRRIGHTLLQVLWTQGDNGRGMLNYSTLVGFAVDDAIGNTYLPGRDTRFSASATRYGVGLALAPEDNLITEFLPDLARRIHVQQVFLRRIINQIAKPDTTSQ